MNKLFAAGSYLKYRLTGGTAHDVHSPFVFELLNNVISDTTPFYCFDQVESLRSKMLLDNRGLEITDLGASGTGQILTKKVSEIAKNSLQEKKYAQLIFRLVNFFGPKNIVELGTSLGITSIYISCASPKSKFITLEGCPSIARIAQENFALLNCKNIEPIVGNFSETLPSALEKIPRADLVYFDGNHRRQPTLDYFYQCKKHRTADTIFIFDDIYWSKEMKSAWDEIRNDAEVTLSIDLYKVGLIFFRNGIPKQHFQLKF